MFADTRSSFLRLVAGVVVAAVAAYAVNVLCVATDQALIRRSGIGQVLAKMHGAAPYEFLLS